MKKILLVISLISVLLLAGCNKNENINNVNVSKNVDNQQQEVIDNNQENVNVTKTADQRKQENISKLRIENISYLDSLPVIEDSSQATLRSKKEVLERALASYVASNVAIDYNWNRQDFEESRDYFKTFMNNYGIDKSFLTDEETIMIFGTPTDEIALNTEWTLESSKVLFWMLGFLNDLDYPSESNICDASELTKIILQYNSFDDMLLDAELLSIEEILDYTDLYYRYHWACRNKRVSDSSTSIGNLSNDIVLERRRALEWAIDSNEDWYNFDQST